MYPLIAGLFTGLLNSAIVYYWAVEDAARQKVPGNEKTNRSHVSVLPKSERTSFVTTPKSVILIK